MARSKYCEIEHAVPVDSCRRDAILEHLLRLSADDRLNRFLSLASDSHVSTYVSGICFAHDIVLGAKRDSRFVGLAHGAVFVERGDLATEIGISVDQDVRRCGLGKRLLLAALEVARRLGVVRAHAIFRSDNIATVRLARNMGARVERNAGESSAVSRLNRSAGVPLMCSRTQRETDVLHVTRAQERGRALLVHGAGGHDMQWVPRLIPRLYRAGYSVCASTLPGHGRRGDPSAAQLNSLLACVAASADAFDPSVIVGHSLGGYVVQRHLENSTVSRSVLLASLPPDVLDSDDLARVKAELKGAHARAVIDHALPAAPNVDVAAAPKTAMLVIGGIRDRVVPAPWIRNTASRYGVRADFVDGGHLLMVGQPSDAVARAIAT
jgi:pimeloyl-ACP methyl ester carboxylesterase/GNAT superfamily N-acetyltransferase